MNLVPQSTCMYGLQERQRFSLGKCKRKKIEIITSEIKGSNFQLVKHKIRFFFSYIFSFHPNNKNAKK